jgi:hypothetical protein
MACTATCTAVVEYAPRTCEGTFKLGELPKECEFTPGRWKIEIHTLIDIPDAIEARIVNIVADFYAKLRGVRLIKTDVKGKLITIIFEVPEPQGQLAEPAIIPILVLIAAIAALVTISLIVISRMPKEVTFPIALALLLFAAAAAAHEVKRRRD